MDAVRAVSGWTFAGQVLSSPIPVVVAFAPATAGAARSEQLRGLAAEYAGRVAVCTLCIDREPELARLFLTESAPAVLAFRDGRVADGCGPGASPDAVRSLFDRLAGPPCRVPAGV